MVKTLSQLYLQARKRLLAAEDPQAAGLYARSLVCHFSGRTPEAFLADQGIYASEEACLQVDDAVTRLLAQEPIAYILGQWDFYGMRLQVSPDVLIPRDDTCAVTELAIHQAKQLESAPRILDLCTGSGCIGLAIARNVPASRVTLADVSEEALTIAKKNVTAHKLSGRVACIRADALCPPAALLGKYDMIVSNPPYITTGEMEQLPVSVSQYEPHLALHGGDDGLVFYRAIAEYYRAALKSGGFLCFEFGMGQGDDVCAILEMNGYTILERSRDYNDIERAVIAQYGKKD